MIFIIIFYSCQFPIGLYAMRVKFKLKCSKWGWDKFCGAKSAYLNMNEINITCNVEIIKWCHKVTILFKIIAVIIIEFNTGMNSIKYEKKIANLQGEL